MSAASRSLPAKKPFGCGYIVFPLLLATIGLALFYAGRQLAPSSDAASAVFRSDPSCGADLRAHPARGACTIVDAEVLVAETRSTYVGGKTPVRTPIVSLRFADGTIHEATLDGGAGNIFPDLVASGSPARVQLFRGTIVRITAGTSSTETIDAPDVDAEDVGQMPWAGMFLIVVGAVVVGLRMYVLRRRA